MPPLVVSTVDCCPCLCSLSHCLLGVTLPCSYLPARRVRWRSLKIRQQTTRGGLVRRTPMVACTSTTGRTECGFGGVCLLGRLVQAEALQAARTSIMSSPTRSSGRSSYLWLTPGTLEWHLRSQLLHYCRLRPPLTLPDQWVKRSILRWVRGRRVWVLPLLVAASRLPRKTRNLALVVAHALLTLRRPGAWMHLRLHLTR